MFNSFLAQLVGTSPCPAAPSPPTPADRRYSGGDAPEGWPWQSHYACTQRSLRHLHTEDRPNKVINQYPIFKWIWGGWGRPLACTLKTYMPHTACEGLILIKRRSPSDQRACIYPTHCIAQGQAITSKHQYSNPDATHYFLRRFRLPLWSEGHAFLYGTEKRFGPLVFSIHIRLHAFRVTCTTMWEYTILLVA